MLIVNHNMSTLAALCNKAFILVRGEIACPMGPAPDVINFYPNLCLSKNYSSNPLFEQEENTDLISITDFQILDVNGFQVERLISRMPVKIKIVFDNLQQIPLVNSLLTTIIIIPNEEVIANLNHPLAMSQRSASKLSSTILCHLRNLELLPGNIRISFLLENEDKVINHIEDAFVGTIDRRRLSKNRTSMIAQVESASIMTGQFIKTTFWEVLLYEKQNS